MDVAQITDALDQVFNDDHVRIVFWNDPNGEFVESLPDIALEGVEVLNLDEVGALEAKVRIEQDDPAGRYLLYSPGEEPDYEDDWLLDMRLYGRSFRADRASIILQELGLSRQHLRQHLAKRRSFLTTKSGGISWRASSLRKTWNSTSTARCWWSSRKPTSPSYSTSSEPCSTR